MLNTSFEPWPSFTQEEADAVSRAILSNKVNYWTGTECREFEKEFAAYTQTKYAVALMNGTVALDVTLKTLNIGAGDDVIVTSRTFLASASAIVTAGANPIFADVELDSQNISRRTIEAVLTPNTKAIICVHLAGWMCDMDPIMALAKEKGLYVIEDCAQAHGAMYKGKPAGSIGHVGAWSFCQDKIMTTGGEGGMVTTNDESLWKKMWSYKDHGKDFDSVYNKQHPPGFRWLHDSFGTNWRMLEVQAVIGRIQLKRMADWTAQRNKNMQFIFDSFGDTPFFTVHKPSEDYVHAAYKTSSIVNDVLSSKNAASADFKGATARFLSRKSRSFISAKICAKLPLIPLFCNWLYRLFARSSALASKNSFTCASGNTTVPMSRPSAIKPSFFAKSC